MGDAHKGRDGEASPPFCPSASLVAELGRSWGISTNRRREGPERPQGRLLHLGQYPPAAFDPNGNSVTAPWVPGELASCQSPSCDEQHARNPWEAMCYPKRLV